jgi:hypothetical protein
VTRPPRRSAARTDFATDVRPPSMLEIERFLDEERNLNHSVGRFLKTKITTQAEIAQ